MVSRPVSSFVWWSWRTSLGTTIVLITAFAGTALISVAQRFLEDVDVPEDTKENVAHHMAFVHESVEIATGNYLAHVMRTGELYIIKHPDIEWVFLEEKERDKDKKRDYIIEHRHSAKKQRKNEGEKCRRRSHRPLGRAQRAPCSRSLLLRAA